MALHDKDADKLTSYAKDLTNVAALLRRAFPGSYTEPELRAVVNHPSLQISADNRREIQALIHVIVADAAGETISGADAADGMDAEASLINSWFTTEKD